MGLCCVYGLVSLFTCGKTRWESREEDGYGNNVWILLDYCILLDFSLSRFPLEFRLNWGERKKPSLGHRPTRKMAFIHFCTNNRDSQEEKHNIYLFSWYPSASVIDLLDAAVSRRNYIIQASNKIWCSWLPHVDSSGTAQREALCVVSTLSSYVIAKKGGSRA